MGGIAGIFGEGSEREVAAMAGRMPYRGTARTWSPATGVYFAELASGENAVATPNGNLAIDSSGHAGPRADIERAFERTPVSSGPECALRGFFAIARWDGARRCLQLTSDRHGYKSLYFVKLGGRVAFASDYKALLALPDLPAVVDRNVLQTYLRSRSFGSDQSLLAGVTPVRGPFTWTIDRKLNLSREKYWKPVSIQGGPRTFDEAAHQLRTLLQSVVRRQLHGRDRIALALSGGLDSVALLALVRNVRPDLRVATYTIGHGESDPDILGAREGTVLFGTDHHEYFLPPERIPAELRRFVWLTEDLTGREEAVLFQVLVNEMARTERAYLVGQGADAAFAGMPRHRLMWLRDHAPPPLRHALGELFVYTQRRQEPRSWLGRRLADLAFRGDRPALPHVIGAEYPEEHLRYRSLGEYRRATLPVSEGMRFHEPMETAGDLEMIAPFCDPAVLDFSLVCPTAFMITAHRQKRVLRAAMQGLLPDAIARRRKGIQRLRHDSALSDVLDDFARQLRLRESLRDRGLVAEDYVAALQRRPRETAYSSERLHILWALLCAELWQRLFIDQRGLYNVPRLEIARPPRIDPATARPSHPAPTP